MFLSILMFHIPGAQEHRGHHQEFGQVEVHGPGKLCLRRGQKTFQGAGCDSGRGPRSQVGETGRRRTGQFQHII